MVEKTLPLLEDRPGFIQEHRHAVLGQHPNPAIGCGCHAENFIIDRLTASQQIGTEGLPGAINIAADAFVMRSPELSISVTSQSSGGTVLLTNAGNMLPLLVDKQAEALGMGNH